MVEGESVEKYGRCGRSQENINLVPKSVVEELKDYTF